MANLDFACGWVFDRGPIQQGGACFEPNTIASHAAYDMNLFYQTSDKNPWNCDFSQSAIFSSNNPTKFSQNTSFLVLLIPLHVTAFAHKLQAIKLALTLVSAPEEDPCTEPFGGDGCFLT